MLVPVILAAMLVLLVALFVFYEPFRVGVQLAQLWFSVAASTVVSWAMWFAGEFVVLSLYPTASTAWNVNLVVAMALGPPVARWVHHSYLSGAVAGIRIPVLLSLAGALVGSLVGRWVLGEQFASSDPSVGITITSKVMYAWLGAVIGGHLHAVYLAGNNIVRRLEP